MPASRTVHCEDALAWLERSPCLERCSIVTSLPDWSEFPALSLVEWKRWFTAAARLVLSRCPDDGVTFFFQTDIKVEGSWVDKGYLCQRAAETLGQELLLHKLVCRRPAGTITFGRPAYSHLLAFSKSVRLELARSTADILPEAGEVTWIRGMGLEACAVACRFIQGHTRSTTVVDPFCGHGTILAAANAFGFDAIGVELGAKRARKARALRATLGSDGRLVLVRGEERPSAL